MNTTWQAPTPQSADRCCGRAASPPSQPLSLGTSATLADRQQGHATCRGSLNLQRARHAPGGRPGGEEWRALTAAAAEAALRDGSTDLACKARPPAVPGHGALPVCVFAHTRRNQS